MLKKLMRIVAILSVLLLGVAPAFATTHPSATLFIQGQEQQHGGTWETGSITLAFNGYTQSVSYGQFSTSASIASAFAAAFSQTPESALPRLCTIGVCAKASGSTINFQLTDLAGSFHPLKVTITGSSFQVGTNQWPSADTYTSPLGSMSLTCSPPQISVGQTTNCTAVRTGGHADNIDFTVDGVFGGNGVDAITLSTTANSATVANYMGDMQPGLHTITAMDDDQWDVIVTIPFIVEALPLSQGTIYSYSIPAQGGYGSNGNIASYTDWVNGQWSLTYDSLNRLTSASVAPINGQAISQCWAYDQFGNRTTQAASASGFTSIVGSDPSQDCQTTDAFTSSWATYDTHNRITGTPSVPVYPATAYDAAGNLQSDGNSQYLYDAEGRVCGVVGAPVNGGLVLTLYIYDAEGQRVAKGAAPIIQGQAPSCNTSTITAVTSGYVIGPSGSAETELDGQGQWVHTNVFSQGQLLATYANDGLGVHFQLSDWLGSRRVQTSYAGQVELSISSGAYGDTLVELPNQNCTPALTCQPAETTDQHFTGKERDTESGLDYFGVRYYASSMGRFMSPDPLNLTEERLASPTNTLNKYAYAASNPLTVLDPDGRDITYFYDQTGLAGHAVLFAYNQKTGDSAIESFGPIIHTVWAAGQSMFDMGPLTTVDDLKKQYSALTISTSPELAQEVIQYMRANPDPANWFALGPNCSTQCSKILQKFKLEMTHHIRNARNRPKLLWEDMRAQYNPSAPANPKTGVDYGHPQCGSNTCMFNLMEIKIRDTFKAPSEGSPERNTGTPCLKKRDTGEC